MKKILVLMTMVSLGLTAWGQNADVTKSDAIMEESLQNFAKAAQLYETAAAAYEANSVYDTLCIYRAGVCYMKTKDFQKSLPFFNKLESRNMVFPELYLSLSDNHAGLKDFPKAKAYLLKALETYPDSKGDVLKKMVPVTYNGGLYAEASKYADEALAVMPNDANIHYIKILSLEQQGRLDDAIAAGEALLAVDPENAKGIEKLGLIICRKTDADYDKEKKRYEAIKAPTRVDFSNTTKKLESISQGYRKAMPYLEQALARNPNSAAVKTAIDNANRRLKQ